MGLMQDWGKPRVKNLQHSEVQLPCTALSCTTQHHLSLQVLAITRACSGSALW